MSNEPDDPTVDEIDAMILDRELREENTLKGYGRKQHGFNGKDADLSEVGQCVLKELRVVDPAGENTMKVEIDLRLYATICAPCLEGFDVDTCESIVENESEELIEYFRSIDADPAAVGPLYESGHKDDEAERILDKLVNYYQDQATWIVSDISFCDDPFAVMWNDDAWEGGIDVTLEVPLSVDEYDAVNYYGDEEDLLEKKAATLEKLGGRVASEIYDANEGGTPQRDKVKQWEEAVAKANEEINKLGCYAQPKPRKEQ